jgi:predicted MPP superfamily phosphohydrolase
MTKICILHASDTHWSSKSDAKQSQIITRLLDDLTAMKSRGVTPDLIVFSGDLVQAGEEVSDFNTAYARLIEPLAASLSLDDERILVCPGNHDIARETVRKQALLEKGLKAQLDSGEAVEEFINSVIAGSEMEALAVRRMANFYSWYDAKFPSCERIGKFCRIRRAYVSGKKVGVALFNTAWRATGEPGELDEGSLILGASVATAAATSLADCDYKIAVLHHPFECHASFDRLLTEKIVAKNFDLLCTGHTHVPNPERTQAVSGSCILSQAGSLYAGSRWYNGYQHVEVDFVHDRTSVYSREYYPVRDEFDASANLLSADPVVFDYAVSDPSAVDQISLFLEKNREIVKDRLVEHINFTNDTIVAEESLLNGYVCPKLFYRGDPVLDESGNVVDSYKKISVEGVLSGPENVAFFGPRQTGKTALKLYLAYQIAYGNAGLPKIPVFIDVKSFQYNLYGLNRALKSLLMFRLSLNWQLLYQAALSFSFSKISARSTRQVSSVSRISFRNIRRIGHLPLVALIRIQSPKSVTSSKF